MDWTKCSPEVLDKDGGSLGRIPSADCLPQLILTIVDVAFIFSGLVALFFIIWSGLRFIQSGGDPKKVDSARKTLTYAIIGLILIFLAFAIINLISYVTGVSCIEFFGFKQCAAPPASSFGPH